MMPATTQRETTMQYMLLIHSSEAELQSASQDTVGRMHAAYMAYTEALTQAGVVVNGNRLRPTSSTTTVRIVDGKTIMLLQYAKLQGLLD